MIKRLGDICTFVGGGTPSKKNPNFYNGSIPWATVRDMNVRVIKTTEHSITPDAVQQSATNIIPKGEVVISTHVGLGKVCFLGQDTAINQDLKAVIPNGGLSRRYLYYWFTSKADELIANGKGATVKGVTLDFVKNLKIQVLPARDQEVVSDTLDKVNHIIELADAQVSRLNQLVKSQFVEMFGEPVSNPKKWNVKRISEFADVRIGPFGSLLHKEDYIQGGHPLVNPSHMVDGTIVPDNDLTLSDSKYKELVAYQLRLNDVVIARRGEIGRCALVEKEGFFCGTGSMFVRIKKDCRADYLQRVISYPTFAARLEDAAVGITMKNINAGMIEDCPIPLPPLAIQREFAAFVAKVDKLAFAARQRRDTARKLYRAKIQEFFG